jgi:hypothetical protein
MNKNIYLKKETIKKIGVYLKEETNYYTIDVVEEVKIFNFILIKNKKILRDLFGECKDINKLDNIYYIENNKVYFKPYINITTNSQPITKYFNNETELYNWLDINFPEYKDFLKL